MSTDHVRSTLRTAAAAYEPDRAAILAWIEHGQAEGGASPAPRSTRRRTAVAAGMAATVAAVLGLSVAVTWAAVRSDDTRQPAAVASATPGPVSASVSSTVARPARSHDPQGRPSSATQPSRPPSAPPSKVPVQQGFLASSGAVNPNSIDNWAQSDVTLSSRETVTALEVRVRIALTPSVASTGAWSTIPAEILATRVEQQPGALVYTFTLKPGARLTSGSYVFAVQYNHATGGRDPSRDSYQAVASAGGTRVEVGGGFSAAPR